MINCICHLSKSDTAAKRLLECGILTSIAKALSVDSASNHHDMRVLQFFHLLGYTLGPEPLPITTFTIAWAIVTDGHFSIFPNRRKSFFPKSKILDDAVA